MPRLRNRLAGLLGTLFLLGALPALGQTRGIDLGGMDRSVAPGDDFFRFANGHWLARTPIPADRAAYGVFTQLTELADKRTVALIRETAKHRAKKGSEAWKIGEFYRTYLDEATIEKKGLAPLEPKLKEIAAISDKQGLAKVLGGQLRADVDPLNMTNFYTDHLFGLFVSQDLSDPTRYTPYLLQGGLGLPDRDYYLSGSAKMETLRAQYVAHVAKMLELAGVADAKAKALRIMDLEHKIAEAHGTRLDSEDVHKANNPWSSKDFTARAPGLDWTAFFTAAGLAGQEHFIVWQPGAVTGEAALVASQPLDTWKEWLTYHAIEHDAGVLPRRFVDERFAFYGKDLSGTPKLRARWKRAVSATDAALGVAVGRLYVERYFPPAAKAKAEAMVKNIIAAFARRIDALSWMAPTTRAKAKAKLETLVVGVGYPDSWRDYSGLEVVHGDAFGNAERAELFEYHRNLKKLGQPVDRKEWWLDPQTVNAVNIPLQNALNFPAAILEPPFFDPKADVAVNYGGIGATIGHEISHSFDDQGSQFDAEGRLANWWTPEDLAHFRAASARLAAQFDAYHPFPDAAVNGKLTLSENIADVAGLSAAYDGYRMSLGNEPAPSAQGMTGDQQFFLSYAQSWREKMREPLERQLLLTDGHAPAEYRADTVRNLDAWYAAFGVQPGKKLFLAPESRVRVW